MNASSSPEDGRRIGLYGALERVTAAEAVVQRLEALILGDQLRPGTPLPADRELAESFGVGRNVLREALKTLVQKRLVEVVPGRGTFVVEPDSSGVTESLYLLLQTRRCDL